MVLYFVVNAGKKKFIHDFYDQGGNCSWQKFVHAFLMFEARRNIYTKNMFILYNGIRIRSFLGYVQ
jgi:hypothetical protein